LEIKEIGKEHEEDLFEDMDLGAWVFLLYFICYVVSSVVYYTSVFYYARPQRALVNPNPQLKEYQAHKHVCPPPSGERIQDVLALLRHHHYYPRIHPGSDRFLASNNRAGILLGLGTEINVI
jgi:hypothetical protein